MKPYVLGLRDDLLGPYDMVFTWNEVERAEEGLADELRELGYAVWQK